MPDVKLTSFVEAESKLDGTEAVYIAQNGKTRKTFLSKVKTFILEDILKVVGDVDVENDGDIAAQLNHLMNKLEDSGWLNLPLQDGISPYNTGSMPKYRKFGNIVQIVGSIKGFASANTFTPATFAILPSGFRPKQKMQFLSQASEVGKWLLDINTDGTICASRYTENNTTMKETMSLTEWMPFSATFIAK